MFNFDKYAQTQLDLESARAELNRTINAKEKAKAQKKHALKIAIAHDTLLNPLREEMWAQQGKGYDQYMRLNRKYQQAEADFKKKHGDVLELLAQSDRGSILLAAGWYDSKIEQLQTKLLRLAEEAGNYEAEFEAKEAEKNDELRGLMDDIEDLVASMGKE